MSEHSGLVVGITGQSGAGTTLLGKIFENHGYMFINADAVYHGMLESDGMLKKELISRFGTGIEENGRINRRALAKTVFFDETALADLNRISHGRVIEKIRGIISENSGRNTALEAVALFESGADGLCDTTVAVVARRRDQIARIIKRDGISNDEAEARINAQRSEEYYRQNAAYIIENTGTVGEFEAKANGLIDIIERKL